MRGTVTIAPVIWARRSIHLRNPAGKRGISSGRNTLSGRKLAASAASIPLRGPHPGCKSATATASERAPAILGGADKGRARSLSSAISSIDRPPNWSKALSRPMRKLRPPASTNPSIPEYSSRISREYAEAEFAHEWVAQGSLLRPGFSGHANSAGCSSIQNRTLTPKREKTAISCSLIYWPPVAY